MYALTMETVLQAIHRLPSLPTVVMELLASIDQEDVNINELVEKIGQDQALTAKTLRLANSSFYGRARQVHSMQEAISILGFRTVRSVVTAAGLIHAMDGASAAPINLTPFWRHAIATAVCARELAAYLPIIPDHAYTAGLLHDIGRLVLVTQFPEQFRATTAHQQLANCTMLEAERYVLGLDHAMIGAALTEYWKFPLPMQQAVGQHHAVQHTDDEALGIAVTVADALAHALDLSQDIDDAVPYTSSTVWQQIPVDDETLLKVFAKAESQFSRAIEVLHS